MPCKSSKKSNRKSKASKGADGTSELSMDPAKIWRPGIDILQEDEELQCDPSTYDCFHSFTVGWPSLSFDILPDGLGSTDRKFPHTIYCISGTQATVAARNSVQITRISNISGKIKDLVPRQLEGDEMDCDSDTDNSDDEDGARGSYPAGP